MTALISLLLSVLIWSLYPLAAAVGLNSMTSLDMIVFIYAFSTIGSLALSLFYLSSKKILNATITINKNLPLKAWRVIIFSGVCGAACHGLFIVALGMTDQGGASLLYESWPLIAMIMTPIFMQKQWKAVNFKEFLISLAALVGVAIVILSDKGINIEFSLSNDINKSTDWKSLLGYVLAFTGAYMCALLVVLKAQFSEYFDILKDQAGASLISELYSRSISFIVVIALYFLLKDNVPTTGVIDWGVSFYIGFVVFIVGGALFTFGILNATSPTAHILYYFVPVMAVVWLWLAGQSEINAGLFIGGAIILLSNISLFILQGKAKYDTRHNAIYGQNNIEK